MRILAWAPPVIAALACVLVAATVIGCRRGWWSIPSLLLLTTIAVNRTAFTAMLVRSGYFPEIG
ncbi:MAG TPA: hypothetical protein VM076_11945 [Gemmatimonadaceae bacterium]|nr:hypothetical protein [Gemmatimonadaceae bacterium]